MYASVAADVLFQLLDQLGLLGDRRLDQVADGHRPSNWPSSTTGRWRRWRSVIRFMQVSTLCFESTLTTGALMIALIGVPMDERPLRTILRA